MDRGAWQATVRMAAQSQTRLKQLSTHTMTSESLIHIRTPKRDSYTHDSIKINAQNSHPPTPYDLDACITQLRWNWLITQFWLKLLPIENA